MGDPATRGSGSARSSRTRDLPEVLRHPDDRVPRRATAPRNTATTTTRHPATSSVRTPARRPTPNRPAKRVPATTTGHGRSRAWSAQLGDAPGAGQRRPVAELTVRAAAAVSGLTWWRRVVQHLRSCAGRRILEVGGSAAQGPAKVVTGCGTVTMTWARSAGVAPVSAPRTAGGPPTDEGLRSGGAGQNGHHAGCRVVGVVTDVAGLASRPRSLTIRAAARSFQWSGAASRVRFVRPGGVDRQRPHHRDLVGVRR
jgi:hypothetical protein